MMIVILKIGGQLGALPVNGAPLIIVFNLVLLNILTLNYNFFYKKKS